MKKEQTIIIDKKVMEDYGDCYFKEHPRARNHPLAKFNAKDKSVGSVFPPSLNEMTNNPNRLAQNGMKQKWKEFIKWLCEKNKISDWKLEKAEVWYKWIFPDRRRRDLDNLVMHIKIINDGFTESGVWEDDCLGKIVLHLDTELHVEKDNPQIIIKIKEL